jgi:hypothetical protein
MNESVFIYTVLAIIIVVVVFGAIMWSLSLQTVPTYSPAPQYTTAGFGGRCSNTPPPQGQNTPEQYKPQICSTGLVCVNNFCYKDLGTQCNSLLECIPGTLVCNGHCSNNNKNALNGVCINNNDCDPNFTCSNLLCKRSTGSSCTVSSDCIDNNFCNNLICETSSFPGQRCDIIAGQNTCTIGHTCSESGGNGINFCQPNVATGSVGAYCYIWNQPDTTAVLDGNYKYITLGGQLVTVPSCDNKSVCNIVRDANGRAINTPLPNYGTCSLTGNWNGQCDINFGCQNPQVCVQNKCTFPVEEGPLKFPLSCDSNHSTGICLNNYTCSADNHECLGKENNNIPVTAGTQCEFGHISSRRNIVFQYFQTNILPTTDRLNTSSWQNTGIAFPIELDGISSENIYFTSFEEKNNNILVLLHNFTSSNFFICNTTGFIKYTVSSNIVGAFTANITYNGTITPTPSGVNLINPKAIVPVTYDGSPDYIGYTTTGNYFAVIRYTMRTPSYPSPQFPGASQPILSDFSKVYYDTSPDFKNSNLSTNSTTGEFQYILSDFGQIKYIYSISVDDRIINPSFPNSVRIFMVMNLFGFGQPPVNSINETIVNTSPKRSGALVGIDFDRTINYNNLTFTLLSYYNDGVLKGHPDFSITWCYAYIFRTMDTLKAYQQCFAKSAVDFKIRAYFPPVTQDSFLSSHYTVLFPYQNDSLYLSKISIYTSKVFDLSHSIAAYIVISNIDTYLGDSTLGRDNVLPATVDINTLLSIPYPDSILDTFGYIPRILLISKVCGT